MGHAYQSQAHAINIYSSLPGEHHRQIAMQIFQLIPSARICRSETGMHGSKYEYYFERVWDMDGKNRADIKPGAKVRIVQKRDQRSGDLTEGIVLNILTNSPTHPHGVKVRLTNGTVGRVKEILSDISDPVRSPIPKV